jgi:hypothetical protein
MLGLIITIFNEEPRLMWNVVEQNVSHFLLMLLKVDLCECAGNFVDTTMRGGILL